MDGGGSEDPGGWSGGWGGHRYGRRAGGRGKGGAWIEMKAVHLLPFVPTTALAAALVSLLPSRGRKWKYVPSACSFLSASALLVLVYRGWERHVGPGPFRWGWWTLTEANLAFLALLAVTGPLSLFLLAAGEDTWGWKQRVIHALGHLGTAGAATAVLAGHPLLLAAGCAPATWCAVALAYLLERTGRERSRSCAALFPLVASDLCLALSVLLLVLEVPSRGSLLFSSPSAGGDNIPAFALMLSAALLRLGAPPFAACQAYLCGRGRDYRLPYLLVLSPLMGGYLLFLAARVVFSPGMGWRWVFLGAGSAVMIFSTFSVLRNPHPGRARGWLAASLGGAFTVALSGGGQGGAAAARLALLSGVPALLMLEASGWEGWRGWARITAGAAVVGLPPLAGFAFLWTAGNYLAEGNTGASRSIFFLGWPVAFLAFLVGGTAAMLSAGEEKESLPAWAAASVFAVACAFLLLVGTYPGRVVDLLMREYGLPLEMPFSSWSSIAWASLLALAGLGILWAMWVRRKGGSSTQARIPALPAAAPLSLMARPFPAREPGKFWVRTAVVFELTMFLGWWGAVALALWR